MLIKGIRFAALILAALTLGFGVCHLAQLPSRMGWDQYLWVGSTVQGGLYAAFGSIGAVIFVATVIVLGLHAYFVREHGRPGFKLALSAAALFALALVLWWVLVYPVNVELAKWVDGPVPADWDLLSRALGMGPRDHFAGGACRFRRADRRGAGRYAERRGSLDLDLDIGAGDAHIVARHSVIGRVLQDLAGPDVEFGAVPRAGHLVSLDLAFA